LFVCLRLAFAKHPVDGAAYAARASSVRGDGLFAGCCAGVRCACTGAPPPFPPSRCRTSALHLCVRVGYARRRVLCCQRVEPAHESPRRQAQLHVNTRSHKRNAAIAAARVQRLEVLVAVMLARERRAPADARPTAARSWPRRSPRFRRARSRWSQTRWLRWAMPSWAVPTREGLQGTGHAAHVRKAHVAPPSHTMSTVI
jgi:hypothetical protein